MKSNLELLAETTGYTPVVLGEIINFSPRNKKRYSTLISNYRISLKTGKGILKNKNSLERNLLNDSYISLYSPRHKSSAFIGNIVQLNEDGIYNLRVLKYLLDRHHFLVSTGLALIGGRLNENAARSVIYSEFKSSKVDFLNSVPRRLTKIRLETFLKSEFDKLKFDRANLTEILASIEL
jgi:hypothetical protein